MEYENEKKSPTEIWNRAKLTLDAALKSGETERAFYWLEDYLKEEHKVNIEKRDDLVTYMGNYESTNKKWNQNMITHGEHEIDLSKIRKGLLNLLKSLIPPEFPEKGTNNKIDTQYLVQEVRLTDAPEELFNTISALDIDYDWNFEENISLYFQFDRVDGSYTKIFSELISDPAWEQFIKRNWFLYTDSEPLGVKIPDTLEPDEEFFRDEPGFVKIEERPLLWIDAIRFEVKDEEQGVVAEAIVIKIEKDSQIWIHAIGESEAKSRFASALLRWFDEKLQGKGGFTICLNVPKGRGATIQPLSDNELEISIKQPFG